MSDVLEQAEPEVAKKNRPRFWVVLVHVFKSAVILPLVVKYLLVVLLMLTSPSLLVAVLVWTFGSSLVYIFTVRRSAASIRRKLSIVKPERCIVPSMVLFAIFALLNFVIDIALANNTGSNPGPLIAASLGFNFVVFVYQSMETQRCFESMSVQETELPLTRTDILVGAGDLVLVVGIAAVLIIAIASS